MISKERAFMSLLGYSIILRSMQVEWNRKRFCASFLRSAGPAEVSPIVIEMRPADQTEMVVPVAPL